MLLLGYVVTIKYLSNFYFCIKWITHILATAANVYWVTDISDKEIRIKYSSEGNGKASRLHRAGGLLSCEQRFLFVADPIE